MKAIIFAVCLVICTLSLQGPAPPLWPETFAQEFVQGDSRSKVYESGKIWYDIKNNRQRVDNSGSHFEPACSNLAQDPSAKCSLIFTKQALYINLPQKAKCCKCCTYENGCKPTPRDWLQDFQYSGEAILSGQTFYKWTQSGQSYYATQDDQRVPRRIQGGSFGLDFIMNTYTTSAIDNSIFQLGSSCQTICPQGSGCGNGIEQQTINISSKPSVFGRKVVKTIKSLRK